MPLSEELELLSEKVPFAYLRDDDCLDGTGTGLTSGEDEGDGTL